jgi:hypothetical protein
LSRVFTPLFVFAHSVQIYVPKFVHHALVARVRVRRRAICGVSQFWLLQLLAWKHLQVPELLDFLGVHKVDVVENAFVLWRRRNQVGHLLPVLAFAQLSSLASLQVADLMRKVTVKPEIGLEEAHSIWVELLALIYKVLICLIAS